MISLLWTDGHLSWLLFSVVAYSLLLILAGDLVWRLVQLPGRVLILGFVASWMMGVAVLILAVGR